MKRYIISTIVSALLSVLVISLSMLTRPDLSVSQESADNTESKLSVLSMLPVNAELSENLEFRTTAGDAQLYISGITDKIDTLIVEMAHPLPADTKYQLYYSIDGSELSEACSITGVTEENTDLLAIKLPAFSNYDILRLDIDTDYTITDISVTKEDWAASYWNSYLFGFIHGRLPFLFKQYIISFVILLVQCLLIAWKWESIAHWCEQAVKSVGTNWRKILRSVIICAICVAVSYLLWDEMYRIGLSSAETPFTLFCFVNVGLAVGLLIALRRQFTMYPERGFLIIALCIGLLFAVVEPTVSCICWDDETHYGRSVSLSYGGTAYISNGEIKNIENLVLPNDVTLDNKLTTTRQLDDISFWKPGSFNNNKAISITNIPAYLAPAAMIWLTRLLGFSVSGTFIAGRVGNLLCYVMVTYFAIRQLKYGKLFLSSLCLLPTILFLAGNYSYDPFCISMILLGNCVWLGVYQRSESKMTGVKTVVMLSAMALGILQKAVYFPMVLIVLLLPNDRFHSTVAIKRYRLAVLLTTFLLMFSIAMPYLMGNGEFQYTDTRGGSDVSASGQIAHILGAPFQYVGLLLRFLFTVFFSTEFIMSETGGCVRALAYMSMQGVVISRTLATIFLVLTAMAWLLSFDYSDDPRSRVRLWIKVVYCLLGFGTIIIVATSLYCCFTPVGSDTILGCQERYMLPIVIPVLVAIRPCLPFKKNNWVGRYNTVVIYAQACVLVIGMLPFIQRFL